MVQEITIRHLDRQPTICLRRNVPRDRWGEHYPEMLRLLLTYLEGTGQQPGGPPYARLLSFENEEAEIEAGVPLDQPLPGEGAIEAGELPAGSVASTAHVGPYSGLAAVHDEIAHWMSERGLRASGPPWEVYQSPPEEEPARTRTEVFWPLAHNP